MRKIKYELYENYRQSENGKYDDDYKYEVDDLLCDCDSLINDLRIYIQDVDYSRIPFEDIYDEIVNVINQNLAEAKDKINF